jgi:hypothetical protein
MWGKEAGNSRGISGIFQQNSDPEGSIFSAAPVLSSALIT